MALRTKCMKVQDRDTALCWEGREGWIWRDGAGEEGEGRKGEPSVTLESLICMAGVYWGHLWGSYQVISGHLARAPEATLYDQIYHRKYEMPWVALYRIFHDFYFTYNLIEGMQGREVEGERRGGEIKGIGGRRGRKGEEWDRCTNLRPFYLIPTLLGGIYLRLYVKGTRSFGVFSFINLVI